MLNKRIPESNQLPKYGKYGIVDSFILLCKLLISPSLTRICNQCPNSSV
jgi:hypothetical protein